MLTYTIRRLFTLMIMLIVLSFLIYLGMELMPGDPIDFLVSADDIADLTDDEMLAMEKSLGLNDPFLIRYSNWFFGVLKGDFGYSYQSGRRISDIFNDTLPATLELSTAALLISTILGTALGVFSATRRDSLSDNLLTTAGMIGLSVPQFLFGMVAIAVFSLKLKWLPHGGRSPIGGAPFFDRLEYLIMPALVLGLALTAGVMRYSRSSMLDSMNKDFVKTARSKGLPEWKVNYIHGFRVAMTPVVVLIGFRIPMLIGGSVIIESVFQWPGIGKTFVDAVASQNYTLVMMISFITAFFVLAASFLVDVLTAVLDPRVKLD